MKRTPFFHIVIITVFLANSFGPIPLLQAQPASPLDGDFRLPAPGVMVHLSPSLNPLILKGIKVHPDNPFRFDFILDQGDNSPSLVQRGGQGELKQEATRLIKYFLASLTIPEKDLWVNLSPYEKDRIIPQSFGLTEMGRDLLAEDYMLKQITASLIYPEDEIGKKFWKRIYEEAAKKFGTTNIPVNTFNKVWIVPEKAVVYENAKAGTAYVVESKLKVMLEQDYLSLEKHEGIQSMSTAIPVSTYVIPAKVPPTDGIPPKAVTGIHNKNDINALGSQIVREIVIPELTKEVNEDKNFAQLRQVYNSLILATWYKKKIKDSILAQVYEDKNKVAGVGYDKSLSPQSQNDMSSPNALVGDPEHIYQRYLQAFKKGVYNYIKEDVDPITQEGIPRKYFSGGLLMAFNDKAMTITGDTSVIKKITKRMVLIAATLFLPTNVRAKFLNKIFNHGITEKEFKDFAHDSANLLWRLNSFWDEVIEQYPVLEPMKPNLENINNKTKYLKDLRQESEYSQELLSEHLKVYGDILILLNDIKIFTDDQLKKDKDILKAEFFQFAYHTLDSSIEFLNKFLHSSHQIVLQPVNLEEFLSSQAFFIEAFTGQKPKIEVNGDVGLVNLDETEFARVIINLAKNSFEANKEMPVQVTIHASRQGDRVTIIFEDNGPGFPQDKLDEGWFFQQGNTTKAGQGGTGTGLMSIKNIVEKHNGKIRAENIKGPDNKVLGARFTMDLDQAMSANTGGIDLTPANMHLQIQNASKGIKFQVDPAMLRQLQNAPGFVPVIINIQPLKSLPEFLGLNEVKPNS